MIDPNEVIKHAFQIGCMYGFVIGSDAMDELQKLGWERKKAHQRCKDYYIETALRLAHGEPGKLGFPPESPMDVLFPKD